MRCKVCGEAELIPLWSDGDAPWLRCLACGSDSAERRYADVAGMYTQEYLAAALAATGGPAGSIEAMRTNLDWFGDHRGGCPNNSGGCPNNSFLDVGCNEGAGLTGMQDRGWAVHGFDVFKPPYFGPHVTVAPTFQAGLFPQQFAAVMAREVIEHVEGWRQFLVELHAVTARGGLLQLQTPRPWTEPHAIPYQRAHLQLFAPFVLRQWLERLGFQVLDSRLWPMGQAWLCRKIDG